MGEINSEYNTLENRFFDLYGRKEYNEARKLIEQMLRDYPHKAGTLYNYTYCARNLAGDSDGALDLMEEAADKGYWSDPEQLAQDEDIANLRDNPRFRKVLERYSVLAHEARINSKPALKIIEPSELATGNSGPFPLVLAFHGNNQSADDAIEQWKFMSEKGWIVALPQSSQITMPGAYVWNDLDVAVPEIKGHYEALLDKYNVDTERIIIAGFSKGGALAATVCLEQSVPCRRFVLMGPYLGDLKGLDGMVEAFSSGKGKDCIFVGENDSDCIEGAKKLHSMLKDQGVDSRLEIIPGLAHAYPEDFNKKLEKNISFLLEPL